MESRQNGTDEALNISRAGIETQMQRSDVWTQVEERRGWGKLGEIRVDINTLLCVK